MAKIVSLLEKMGLVRSEEPPVPAAGADDFAAPSQAATAADASTQTAPAPPVTLDVASLEEPSAEGEFTVEQVYSSAGIVEPVNGFTVYRLIEMLEAEEFRGMDTPTRAKVIAGLLRRLPTGAVEIGDIVRDAEARDRALDAFERFLADRAARQEKDTEEKNRALQQQIDELTRKNKQEMEANRAAVEQEKARLERWRARKRAEEDRLFNAVQPFVEHNPVTRSGEPSS